MRKYIVTHFSLMSEIAPTGEDEGSYLTMHLDDEENGDKLQIVIEFDKHLLAQTVLEIVAEYYGSIITHQELERIFRRPILPEERIE